MTDDPLKPIRSLETIVTLFQENEALIDRIRESFGTGAATVAVLADKLEKNRREAEILLGEIQSLAFERPRSKSTRKTQKMLLKEIGVVGKKIRKFADFPALVSGLLLHRSALFVELGNTYNDLTAEIVSFDEREVERLRKHLRRATLDAESRHRLSSILEGAVNISKFALSFGLGLT